MSRTQILISHTIFGYIQKKLALWLPQSHDNLTLAPPKSKVGIPLQNSCCSPPLLQIQLVNVNVPIMTVLDLSVSDITR